MMYWSYVLEASLYWSCEEQKSDELLEGGGPSATDNI
jgi:hypothetical protein